MTYFDKTHISDDKKIEGIIIADIWKAIILIGALMFSLTLLLLFCVGSNHYKNQEIEAYQPLLSMPIPQCGERESKLDGIVWEIQATDLGETEGMKITAIEFCKEPKCEPCEECFLKVHNQNEYLDFMKNRCPDFMEYVAKSEVGENCVCEGWRCY